MATAVAAASPSRALYRTVWRWHFYAGLFCIPFVLWLSVTGSIYLFKPQIDTYLDRPYDSLTIAHRAPAAQVAAAAIAAMPGSMLHAYELPVTNHGAARVIVGRGKDEYRVYVHPETLQVLGTVREKDRFTQRISRLHGELMLGNAGSVVVELAASWAIVLLLTGLYLWWPRQVNGLAGVLWPRLRAGRRLFWRDLHAVTGLWISGLALFLILTGLQWAWAWGGLFKQARAAVAGHTVKQDWATGSSTAPALVADGDDPHAAHKGMMPDGMMTMPDGTVMPMSMMGDGMVMRETVASLEPLDRVAAAVAPLRLAYPVLVSPPMAEGAPWTAKSDAQNRPLRVNLKVDGATGKILSRVNFAQRPWLDRMLGTSIAIHEGQAFGVLNQVVGLLAALGLITLCVSAVAMWWRRRAVGVLGAPVYAGKASLRWIWLPVVLVCLYLPVMAASLIVVLLTERLVLRRIEPARVWLGL